MRYERLCCCVNSFLSYYCANSVVLRVVDALVSEEGGVVLAAKAPQRRKAAQVTQMNLLLDPSLDKLFDDRRRSMFLILG